MLSRFILNTFTFCLVVQLLANFCFSFCYALSLSLPNLFYASYLGIQQIVFGGRCMGDWEEGMTNPEYGYKYFKI